MWWFNFNPQLSPQVHWPFSGAVTQDIHPSLLARAGDDETELRVLREVASYGKQIGILSDLVLGLAERLPPDRLDADAAHALDQLRDLGQRIAAIKQGRQPVPPTLDEARSQMTALLQHYPELATAEETPRRRR